MIFLDALLVEIRDGGQMANRAVYVYLGVNLEGGKEVLGPWGGEHRGRKV